MDGMTTRCRMHFARPETRIWSCFPHVQRRVLFLHFFKAKTAECIWARVKNAFGLWFLPYGASVFDTKVSYQVSFLLWFWKEQAARMHFAFAKCIWACCF